MTIGLFVLGTVGFATVPGLQAHVLQHAEGAATLASAVNIVAFNLGNSLGVTLAGITIWGGFGLLSPALVGTALSTIGLGLVMAARVIRHTETGNRHGSAAH